ncbi:MAG: heavy-metal-associated domain-containing protein [bacterium]|nr:heavy-metal-associated domain-containing protein [bacterium]
MEGMHCNSCAMLIDLDLEDLVGIKSVKTNYTKQITEVEFEPHKVTEDQIIEQIKKTGYGAYFMS